MSGSKLPSKLYEEVLAHHDDDAPRLACADWLAAHLEEWMVTTQGELVEAFYVDDLPAFFKQLRKR